MTFGIDFDGTYAADPPTFHRLVDMLKRAGHRCVLVTGRPGAGGHGEAVRAIIGDRIPIVFAGPGRWKRHAARDAGFEVDVWIDDDPEHIGPQVKILEGAAR
jgi:hypothetical protein